MLLTLGFNSVFTVHCFYNETHNCHHEFCNVCQTETANVTTDVLTDVTSPSNIIKETGGINNCAS